MWCLLTVTIPETCSPPPSLPTLTTTKIISLEASVGQSTGVGTQRRYQQVQRVCTMIQTVSTTLKNDLELKEPNGAEAMSDRFRMGVLLNMESYIWMAFVSQGSVMLQKNRRVPVKSRKHIMTEIDSDS